MQKDEQYWNHVGGLFGFPVYSHTVLATSVWEFAVPSEGPQNLALVVKDSTCWSCMMLQYDLVVWV